MERYHATSVLSLTARHPARAERLDFKRFVFGRAVGRVFINASLGRMSASLIGRLGQALSGYPATPVRCRSRARASLRTRHQGPSIMGFEDEVEQSLGRPCRQCNGRLKRTYELTSSIVPRGTSFHRSLISSYRI